MTAISSPLRAEEFLKRTYPFGIPSPTFCSIPEGPPSKRYIYIYICACSHPLHDPPKNPFFSKEDVSQSSSCTDMRLPRQNMGSWNLGLMVFDVILNHVNSSLNSLKNDTEILD